jgi:hypothetical protein
MPLKPQDIQEYRALYRARFGVDISREHAATELAALVDAMRAVYLPMTENQHARVLERRDELGLRHE